VIIEEFTKLDESKRKVVAVLTVLVVACICYFGITRNPLMKLKAANADYTGIQTAYANTENQEVELLNLQKQLEEKEKQLQEHQQQCFSSREALQFFENINVMALACNLKPISRVVSEPKNLVDDKDNDGETGPERQFLKKQSAEIAVVGNYFDIVDFVNQLADCSQKVCITNLYITLPAGEKFNPKASFKITLVIDLSRDI
jgi:Tfp pilus assembly protein PilO